MMWIDGEKIFSRKVEYVYYVEIDTKKTLRNKTISSILKIDADVFYLVDASKEGTETLDIHSARFWKDEGAALSSAKKVPGGIAIARKMSTRDFVKKIVPPSTGHVGRKTQKLINSEKRYLSELDELLSDYLCDPEFYKIPDVWHRWSKCKSCGLRPLICLNACPSTGCGCMDGNKHLSIIVSPPKYYVGGSNYKDSSTIFSLRNEWNRVNV
jgi:hypothetical protein